MAQGLPAKGHYSVIFARKSCINHGAEQPGAEGKMKIAYRFLARLGLMAPAGEDAVSARYAMLAVGATRRSPRRATPSPFRFSARGGA